MTHERTPDTTAAAAPDDGQRTPATTRTYTAREAAAAIGVSERTIRRAIARGELIADKQAGQFRIAPSTLAAYRAGQRTTGTPSAAAAPDRSARPLPRTPEIVESDAPDSAAAADTGPSSALVAEEVAAAIWRELYEGERAKTERLIEAAAVWQTRAIQAEERLKQLTAGEDARVASPAAPGEADAGATTPDAHGVGPPAWQRAPKGGELGTRRPWWRFWERPR